MPDSLGFAKMDLIIILSDQNSILYFFKEEETWRLSYNFSKLQLPQIFQNVHNIKFSLNIDRFLETATLSKIMYNKAS